MPPPPWKQQGATEAPGRVTRGSWRQQCVQGKPAPRRRQRKGQTCYPSTATMGCNQPQGPGSCMSSAVQLPSGRTHLLALRGRRGEICFVAFPDKPLALEGLAWPPQLLLLQPA